MTRVWRSGLLPAVAALAAGACGDGGGGETVLPPDPDPVLSCAAGGVAMQPGQVLLLTAAEARELCLEGGASAGRYLYVPFFASERGTANLALELSGEGITPGAARLDAGPGPTVAAALRRAEPRADELFHHRFRQREHRDLGAHMPLPAAARGPARAAAVVPPTVGALVTLNTSTECDSVVPRVGRVEAVSRTAIVVADTANPAGGFTADDWRFFAQSFDTLVNPVAVENFGQPTDIDENGRVVIFFTRAVNELTEAGSDSYVGGFFWGGDLFPEAQCAGSNGAEMFYMLVPDPEGLVNENVRPLDFVRRVTVGVLGHEYQHLINAGHRLYLTDASAFEEVWLNEGLSHVAEELLFYRTTGLVPRQNVTVEDLTATDHRWRQFVAYGASNLGRFEAYLQSPTRESLLGIDNLPTRGASWAFLRYAADHQEGPDAPLFRALVDGRTTGIDNLRNVLGAEPLTLIQAWTVSNYTDDAVPQVPAVYTQPSWDFRSVMRVFAPSSTAYRYPLEVLAPGADGSLALSIRGGGAAYVRFDVAAGETAAVRATSGGAAPPASLRVSVVRLP